MKIPTALRRPFYNKSEIHHDGPDQNGQHDSENGIARIKTDKETHEQPVGFWHPELRKVRNRAFAKWTTTTAFLMAFILAVLSIYWGVFFGVQNRLDHLAIYVVDMDGVAPFDSTGNQPLVGPTITKLVEQTLSEGKPTLGWSIRPASEFNNDPMQVRQAVYDFHAWAAIIINPNATAMLYQAIATGNTSYEPLGACQLVYQDSRDDTNWSNFMLPIISPFMTQAQSMVGQRWAGMVMQNASDAGTLSNIQAVPQAINPAIGFSEYNLRPFYPYTGIPAVNADLIIISFFSFSFYLPIHMQFLSPKGHPPLKVPQLVLWRWFATISAYFMLSLAYSLVSLAFQINFSTTNPVTSTTEVTEIAYGNPISYGHGTFLVYWMLNFFGMIALGLACENMAMVVGQPWMGCFLIFWVITNVSTSFYDIEISPAFYRWGYAWPLHSIVEGSRSILFGLHSRLGLDFGILIAWGAVNTAFFPVCCWFQRWKKERGVQEYWG
ncbi:MNNG and nitrosoguanidine resistance protein [Paraphoma chrysanthemicola]|uniref:MNNG and nitrosoguanidine resistance protein n=1 Tax=Paraphoma chrysanthemicola TaxID=798071 RepID=A0A8K0RB47_9PLEO|nr:MNNG and nitrosoguanidine resistance protein [Paraphoma chrysanthemicola]